MTQPFAIATVADIVLAGFDGQKLSKDNPITVEWTAAGAPTESMLHRSPASTLIEEDGMLDDESLADSVAGSKLSLSSRSRSMPYELPTSKRPHEMPA